MDDNINMKIALNECLDSLFEFCSNCYENCYELVALSFYGRIGEDEIWEKEWKKENAKKINRTQSDSKIKYSILANDDPEGWELLQLRIV